jgi:hypothetical protein
MTFRKSSPFCKNNPTILFLKRQKKCIFAGSNRKAFQMPLFLAKKIG